jgi:Ca-activated chloride channel family protein
MLKLRPKKEVANTRPPTTFVFLIDTSGSMDELFGGSASGALTKRQGVMQAAKAILPQLAPQDTVTLVFYNDKAYPIARHFASSRRQDLERLIDSLPQYNGGTNFVAALETTLQLLKESRNPSRRVLFLTDGNNGYGSAARVVELAREVAGQGAVLDGMGVGADFNFAFMRDLSAPSNGFTERLDSPQQAESIFGNLVLTTQRTAATRVFLNFVFPPGLRDVEVYQHMPEMRFQALAPGHDGACRLELNVQTLRRDKRNVYLFKVHLDAPATGPTRLLAELRVDFDVPSLGLQNQRVACNALVSLADDPTQEIRDTGVDALFEEAELTKLYEQFLAVKDTDWQKGVSLLNLMLERAVALTDRDRIEQYTRARDQLQQNHNLSNDDLNRIGRSSSRSTQAATADIRRSSAGPRRY